MRPFLLSLALALSACAAPQGIAGLRAEALRLAPTRTAPLARRFVEQTPLLPPVATQIFYLSPDRARCLDEREVESIPAAERATWKRIVADEEYQYAGRWGSPLAYALPLEVLGANGLTDLANLHVFDFGYGDLGHMQLFAALGADAVGVDVDPCYLKMYGARQGAFGPGPGKVRLVDGKWPTTEEARAGVGSGPFDLIISKNVLKNGYIHPSQPIVPPARPIILGVDDATFLRAVFDSLRPGGRFLIYNICPAPAPPGKPYIPWADGRSPFSKEQFEQAGFRVISHDIDDTAATRSLARTLGWDRGSEPMDVEHDLFAHYTLVERP